MQFEDAVTGTLQHYEKAFARIGWFIPAYIGMGGLSFLTAAILGSENKFTEDHLEGWLCQVYDPVGLAAMAVVRYPETPIICNFKESIAEAIEAHFLGLHHVAVAGLIPVIEGAGRQLLKSRGLPDSVSIQKVFISLANDCKQQVITKKIGDTGEIISMLNAFVSFARNVMYADSSTYTFLDKTNRHGITHGRYQDSDYGRPLNFYKTIGAVDFLCFLAALQASISWFAASSNAESQSLAEHYRLLQHLARKQGRV
jgi:hypothetical protein